MRSFEHVDANTVEAAVELLEPGARIIAGGTDLLTEMKAKIVSPSRLVNLKTVRNLDLIEFSASGGLKLGSLATLDSIERHPVIREKFPVLSQAASLAASPQIRNAGTLGGNLCQDNRCWYYRGPFNCLLKGGEKCYAKHGENRNHAIFGGDPCWAVNPSDLAPALVALDAVVSVHGADGRRTIPIDEFFSIPGRVANKMNVLESHEIITDVFVPKHPLRSRGTYLKAMDRKVWSFALASVAVQVSFKDGGAVNQSRIVLGSAAPIPWRARQAETALQGKRLTYETIAKAVEASVNEARPLSQNAYKVTLCKGLVRKALRELSAS